MEALIRRKEEELSHSSLSLREEKARLQEMKKLKDDAKAAAVWDAERDRLRNERSQKQEQLQQAFEELGKQRDALWHDEVAAQLQLPRADITMRRLPRVDEAVLELLATAAWRKKLLSKFSVVAKTERGANRAVRLAGTAEAVQAAAAEIESLRGVAVRHVNVSDAEQALLIGRGGRTITQLQEKHACALEIHKPSSKLTVAGLAADVARAEAEVRELLENQRRIEVSITFDPEQKGTLIGKGGSTINRVQAQSGAVLELGKGADSTVKISGPAACVQKAREALAELLHLDAKKVQPVDVPAELVDMVSGRGGENLRRLEAKHGVGIDHCRPSGLKVRGAVEGVAAAVAEVEALVERERRIEESFFVRSQHIGMLLGKVRPRPRFRARPAPAPRPLRLAPPP